MKFTNFDAECLTSVLSLNAENMKSPGKEVDNHFSVHSDNNAHNTASFEHKTSASGNDLMVSKSASVSINNDAGAYRELPVVVSSPAHIDEQSSLKSTLKKKNKRVFTLESDTDSDDKNSITGEKKDLSFVTKDDLTARDDSLQVGNVDELSSHKAIKMKKKSKILTLESDSDNDRNSYSASKYDLVAKHDSLGSDEDSRHDTTELKSIKRRKVKAIESDSDSDSNEERSLPEPPLYGNIELSNTQLSSEEPKKIPSYMSMFQNTDLYDAEGSSDEESAGVEVSCEESESYSNKKQSKSINKKHVAPRKSKLSAIEEIRSESQRMLRHSRVALPYHQPKQRSLAEFLSRRKVPIVPLKTTTEQLSEVWQCIEEREKTAESFYKSESDSENEIAEANSKNECLANEPLNNSPSKKETLETISSTCVSTEVTETDASTSCPAEINSGPSTGLNVPPDAVNANKASAAETISKHVTDSTSKTILPDEPSVVTQEMNSEKLSESESLNLCLSEKTILELSTFQSSDKLIEENSYLNVESLGKSENDVVEQKELDHLINQSSSVLETSKGSALEFNSTSAIAESSKSFTENTDKVSSKRKIHTLLHQSLLDVKLDSKPKISGSPDSFIDLDEGSEKPSAMKLVTRFMKHVKLKPRLKKQEQKISVTVTEVNDKGEVIGLNEEILSIKPGENSKPGESRFQLKAKLKEKIAQRREEEFVKRVEEYKMSEELIEDDCEGISDFEEEIEEDFKKYESATTESEPEEDDMDITDKVNKRNNPFLDEEAEETDDEGYDNIKDGKEEDMSNSDLDDVDNYSEPPSVNVAPLLDERSGTTNTLSVATGLCGIGLSGLCSGSFPSQGLNLEELEKIDKPNNGEQNEKLDLYLSEDVIPDPFDKSSVKKVDEGDESSDEEIFSKKPKKVKILALSDDEDEEPLKPEKKLESDEEENEDEENVGNDEDDENIDNELSDEDNPEESGGVKPEVELDEDEDEEAFLKNPSTVAKRFFEDEAELSGSEYGSGDEDEANLDKYEEEEGDSEVFQQRKLQRELERLHMKNMLDDDKREIRILQELLLEDGELHSDGPKRQRQFKWYNQDENLTDNHSYIDEDDDNRNEQEEEEDESWRKYRVDRENFLHSLQIDDIELDQVNINKKEENKFIKPSPKISLKANSLSSTSPNPRKQFTLLSKRGSFLSRGEKLLSKLAEITNVVSENPLGNTRSNRSMVFAVVSPPKEKETEEEVVKRKRDFPAPAAKRLKFTTPKDMKNGTSVFDKLKLIDK